MHAHVLLQGCSWEKQKNKVHVATLMLHRKLKAVVNNDSSFNVELGRVTWLSATDNKRRRLTAHVLVAPPSQFSPILSSV